MFISHSYIKARARTRKVVYAFLTTGVIKIASKKLIGIVSIVRTRICTGTTGLTITSTHHRPTDFHAKSSFWEIWQLASCSLRHTIIGSQTPNNAPLYI
jgi:hypothetical protein